MINAKLVKFFFLYTVCSTLFISDLLLAEDDYCWEEAAVYYGVDSLVLYSIASVESDFNSFAVNKRQGGEDVGLMQISSYWYPHLKKFGISREDLFDACTCIYVGAWVLSQQIQIFGNSWEAVGAYNVGTSRASWAYGLREKYIQRVFDRYTSTLKFMLESSTEER